MAGQNGELKKRFSVASSDQRAIRIFNMAEGSKKVDMMTFSLTVIILVIGFGTLVAGVVGISNIMIFIVKERTKEIGTRKAIGAKSSTVLNQFVIEAITICQLGGLGGVLFGLLIGNLTSNYIGGSFIVPWNWMILALVVCTVVGLSAGIWPAYKASKINPIEALRYE